MQKRPLSILLFAVFVDRLNFGILLPILPILLADPSSEFFLFGSAERVGLGLVLLGLLRTVYAVSEFLAAPVLGQLSDRYGRKPLLMVALAGSTLSYVLFALGVVLGSVPLLFVSRFADGATGGNVAVSQSALADVTDDERRTQGFGYYSAALSLGFVFGPLLGGLLSDPSTVGWFTPATPFWLSAILGGANLLLLLFAFPETLEEKKEVRLTPGRSVRNVAAAFEDSGRRAAYGTVLLFTLGFAFFTSFFNVFLIQRLGYDQRDIGYFFTALGAGFFLVQTLLVERVRGRFGSVLTLQVVLFGTAATVLLTTLVRSTWQLYALVPLFALFNGLVQPNLVALVSRSAGGGDQGRILGVNSSLQSLGRGVPPAIAGPLAALSSAAVPIIVGGVSVLLAGGVFSFLYRNKEPEGE